MLQSVLLVNTPESIKIDFNLDTTVNYPSTFPLPLLVCFYTCGIVQGSKHKTNQ